MIQGPMHLVTTKMCRMYLLKRRSCRIRGIEYAVDMLELCAGKNRRKETSPVSVNLRMRESFEPRRPGGDSILKIEWLPSISEG